MDPITAVYRNGHLELTSAVPWPEGTAVEVRPLLPPTSHVSWLSLPPLDVGEFRELTNDDDLLEQMLDDSRN